MTYAAEAQETSPTLEASSLLFDLKKCAVLIDQFSGCLNAEKIAKETTDGLIEQFDCAFARIWLINSDRSALRLIASSGLYTHLNGSFARVPMGAFKVGKIAQHCIPFLSNCLPAESWVKDRQWAIENSIQGFAGLPLMQKDSAIGVIAIFSYRTMAPEFLEALQILSVSVANALASAVNHQNCIANLNATDKTDQAISDEKESLSESLAKRLGTQKLSLIGTEQTLSPAVTQLLIQLAEQIAQKSCQYCRLVYESTNVSLEAILANDKRTAGKQDDAEINLNEEFAAVERATEQLGGNLKISIGSTQTVINVQLPQQIDPSTADSILSPLSEREQEVILRLAHGLRDREIAQELFISDRTVKFHVKNILKKLDVRTRSHAVFEATKQGWLS